MKKPIGAIVIYSIGVLFGVYLLISSICQHDRPISIILTQKAIPHGAAFH